MTSSGCTRSINTPEPTAQEQAWAKSLRDFFAFDVPVNSASAPQSAQIQVEAISTRDRYSLIKNISAGERGAAGKFFDLAGEVVKMYFNSQGYLDLYICDYTVNKDLHDYKPDEIEGKGKQCPVGKVTLHIEMHQPHGSWTHQNVKEGDLIRVDNVRIKWNQRGCGSELEGNLWQDKFYPDKVAVRKLTAGDDRISAICSRRAEHMGASGESKAQRKRKRRQEKEKEAKSAAVSDTEDGQAAKRTRMRDSGVFLDGSDETVASEDKKAAEDLDAAAEVARLQEATKGKLNPNGKSISPILTQ